MTAEHALRNLYMAGRWTCTGVSDEQQTKLWTDARDALGLPAGTATARGMGAPPTESRTESIRNTPI